VREDDAREDDAREDDRERTKKRGEGRILQYSVMGCDDVQLGWADWGCKHFTKNIHVYCMLYVVYGTIAHLTNYLFHISALAHDRTGRGCEERVAEEDDRGDGRKNFKK